MAVIEAVQKFLKKEYPDLQLSDAEIEQLTWRMDGHTEYNTPEQAMIDDTDPNYQQIKRIGGRLNCLKLVTDNDYAGFVKAQEAHLGAYNQVLSPAEFATMRERFLNKDKVFTDTLEVCTIVGGINLTEQVRQNAKALGVDFTNDSVQGMADLFDDIENAKKIFPLVKALYDKHEVKEHARITQHLQAAFSHNTHLRHMMYTECNHNGFRNILERMQQRKLSQESLDFTINYWLTDIFGFRSNVSPEGSIYYTHNTHIAFEALCEQLKRGLNDQEEVTAEDLFKGYLLKRAEWLGLNQEAGLTPEDQMLLAHLGSMMRLFSTDHGKLLAAGMKLIPEELRELATVYFVGADPDEPTPTYVPALFANAIECRKQYYLEYAPQELLNALPPIKRKDSELRDLMATMDTTALFLSFYLKTLKIYREDRASGKITDLRSPLSYRNFAYKPTIEQLFKSHWIFREKSPYHRKFNAFDTIDATVDSKGNVGHRLKGNQALLRLTNFCYLKLEQLKSWYYSPATHQQGLLNYFKFWQWNTRSCAAEAQPADNA